MRWKSESTCTCFVCLFLFRLYVHFIVLFFVTTVGTIQAQVFHFLKPLISGLYLGTTVNFGGRWIFFIIVTFWTARLFQETSKIIGKNTPPQFFSRSLRRRGYKAPLGAREENREHAIEIDWLWNMSKRVKSKAVVDSDSEDSEEEVEVSTGVVIYSHQTRSLVVHTTSLSDA